MICTDTLSTWVKKTGRGWFNPCPAFRWPKHSGLFRVKSSVTVSINSIWIFNKYQNHSFELAWVFIFSIGLKNYTWSYSTARHQAAIRRTKKWNDMSCIKTNFSSECIMNYLTEKCKQSIKNLFEMNCLKMWVTFAYESRLSSYRQGKDILSFWLKGCKFIIRQTLRTIKLSETQIRTICQYFSWNLNSHIYTDNILGPIMPWVLLCIGS